ncbi:MAG: hypothetical protein GY696_38070 [Gammaproteobacteria bacterium]|nr:hypothetical protein [Gammaproteobacteria bacterium]
MVTLGRGQGTGGSNRLVCKGDQEFFRASKGLSKWMEPGAARPVGSKGQFQFLCGIWLLDFCELCDLGGQLGARNFNWAQGMKAGNFTVFFLLQRTGIYVEGNRECKYVDIAVLGLL